jgi:hypothetical protein
MSPVHFKAGKDLYFLSYHNLFDPQRRRALILGAKPFNAWWTKDHLFLECTKTGEIVETTLAVVDRKKWSLEAEVQFNPTRT